MSEELWHSHGAAREPRQVGFLILPRFPILGFASAIAPLRQANLGAGRRLYDMTYYSRDGGAVEADGAVPIAAHAALAPPKHLDMVFVCAGFDPDRYLDPKTLAWLRYQDRHGALLGSISTGTHLLAAAGLLDGCRCTIHWENADSFMERFPAVTLTNSLYEVDHNRFTCAGGTAALDMMLHIIARDHGPDLAFAVGHHFQRGRLRSPGEERGEGWLLPMQLKSSRLATAARIMEENIETPLSPMAVAARVGLSQRQLDRLFTRHVGCAPSQYAMRLRLRHARHLLLQTGLPLLEVAMAVGFSSRRYFSKCYKRQFGRSPKEERVHYAALR